MKNIALLLFLASLSAQTVIGEGLTGQELWDYVVTNYKTTTTLGYTNARDTMYAVIDLKEGDQLTGVYSGYTITLEDGVDPSTNAYEQGINCEHTFPQSMGAEDEPQKSDMHHLFPCKSNINSSRGNDPYAEIPDEDTEKWYRNDYYQTEIPTEYIEEYAEKYNPLDPAEERFEPREDHKGNAARAVFYFYSIYNDVADNNFWEIQKETLLNWHYYDSTNEIETERTWKIAEYQDGLPNPFVLDSTLARRIWYPQPNLSVEYSGGWNMVGLPLIVTDNNYLIQFPNSIEGTLYSFNSNYQNETNLENGSGYWLRFNGNNFNVFAGESMTELSFMLNEGWNMITGLDMPIQVENIIDNEGIIIDGTIYGFNGGYQEVDAIETGRGYWVRTNNSGSIILISP